MSVRTPLVEWNERLAAALLVPRHADEPLYLYVDEDVLADAGGLPREEALGAFLAACRPFTSAIRPFGYAARQAKRWQQDGLQGHPPHLWALALTVLAVTCDPVGGTDSVYRVQNRLLGLPEDTTAPPGYAEDVPQLWTSFNEWLQHDGSDFGLPTARSHSHWVRQGWARSQALFRFRDRQLIDAFFVATGLPPGSRPNPAVLLEAFEQWLRYRGAAGESLLSRLRGSAERAVAADVLADEAARWSGSPRSRGDVGVVAGLLTVDDWTDTLGAVVRGDQMLGAVINPGDGSRIAVDESTGFVQLFPSVSSGELLENGYSIPVAADLTVRVAGAPAYVFVDEPSLGLMIQAVGPRTAPDCRLLVRQSHVPDVEAALTTGSVAFKGRPAAVDGWTWISVRGPLPESPSLAVLGLGGLTSTPRPASRLSGGLCIAPLTYLCGGEPALELPTPGVVLVDDTKHHTEGLELRLNELAVDPGSHTVTCPDGQVLRFRSVAGIRARSEGGGFGWPLATEDNEHRVAGACQRTSTGLSGAQIPLALPNPEVPMLRRGREVDYLAVYESGAVIQFWPSQARWVAEAGIDPLQVDPLQAVRTSLSTRPRAFLSWNRRSGRVSGTEISADAKLLPGAMRRQERPDLVAEVFGRTWHWHGSEAPKLQAQLRALSMTWARDRHPSPVQGAILTAPRRRPDIREGAYSNPYDDLLCWLSEKESGAASLESFRDTWAWACEACGIPELSYQWRRALIVLGELGHVEVDRSRGRVAVTPGTLLRLPVSNGLQVLCGARPTTLLERMDDPDDRDERVAEANSALIMHRRTPFRDGRPAGPTALFVEWDMACREAVVQGLRILGVELETGSVLTLLPSLDEALETAVRFSAAPARHPQLRSWSPSQPPQWRDGVTDDQPGLYRYRLSWRDVFGFRAAAGEPVVEIDRHLGIWADERARGREPRLLHHPATSRLLVDKAMPLTPLLARGLALRTGLPPWLARQHRTDERPAPSDYLVYDNVNAETAQQAARTIGQQLITTTSALEVP